MKKIHLLLLFSVIWISPILELLAQTPNFNIELAKSVYLKHEPVWVKFILNNEAKETIMVSRELTGSTSLLRWKLTDAAGKELEYRWILPHTEIPTYPLSPGDTIFSYFNLLFAFGEKDPPISPICYLEEGVYHLSAVYDPYRNPVEAKPVSFSVERPQGMEAEALVLYEKAYYTWLVEKKYEKAGALYKNLINKYPNSVYLESAYNMLLVSNKYGYRNFTELMDISEEFIKNRPYSPFVKNMLYHMAAAYRGLDRIDDLEKKLIHLAEQYEDSNPIIRRAALREIDEISQQRNK